MTSCTSVDLPEPETPVMHDHHVERDLDVDALQVVLAGSEDSIMLVRVDLAGASRGTLISQVATQILAGERRLVIAAARPNGALENQLATVLAGTGPDVENVVGRAHHLRLVLDDEHRVADVAQVLEDADQPRVVARVQADRRLVEHVQRADQ